VSKWLNWSRASGKSPASGEESTDKTDRTGNQAVFPAPGRLDHLSDLPPAPPVDRNGVRHQAALMGRSLEIRESQRSITGIATTEPLFEIAVLLATAYRRYQEVQRAGGNRSQDSGNDELANSSGASVHGVVP
jgi:hypothetical protein